MQGPSFNLFCLDYTQTLSKCMLVDHTMTMTSPSKVLHEPVDSVLNVYRCPTPWRWLYLQDGPQGNCRGAPKRKGLGQHGQQLPSQYWQGQAWNGPRQPLEEEVLLCAVLDGQILQEGDGVDQLVLQHAAFC